MTIDDYLLFKFLFIKLPLKDSNQGAFNSNVMCDLKIFYSLIPGRTLKGSNSSLRKMSNKGNETDSDDELYVVCLI